MTPFTTLTAIAAPLLRDNIDTDAIIPSREITAVSKTGLADGLFAGWRYTAIGGRTPAAGFVLNHPAYRGAHILLTGANFGCGSSREHAAWALAEYGFRAIVAPSFNPIFRGNCVRNGMVPVELAADVISALAVELGSDPAARPVSINLPAQRLTTSTGAAYGFEIEQEAKAMLISGLDAIDLTSRRRKEIAIFRAADRRARPWAYLEANDGR